jgi:hypothetical protein
MYHPVRAGESGEWQAGWVPGRTGRTGKRNFRSRVPPIGADFLRRWFYGRFADLILKIVLTGAADRAGTAGTGGFP